MSRKELERVGILARNQSGELKLKEAAELMGVSYRQAKRLRKDFREQGAVGLRHGNAGQRSHNRIGEEERKEILALVREHYGGGVEERFGPTLAAEHLEGEHGRKVHRETLRRWMLQEGLWSRVRKRRAYRKKREAKGHFGQMLQLDGSHHEWLEERGCRGCLMNLVDDATGRAEMRLEEEETIWGAVRVLRSWIERYGVPLALYVDRKNIYVPSAGNPGREQEPITQFGRMCRDLGIRIIPAGSPQAKGRVERAHGTHQDRLVKKLRRKKIASYEQANEFLQGEYVEEHNRRFSRPAAEAADYHRPAPGRKQLERILRREQERVVSNDWVVRHQGRYFQLQRQREHYAPARARVKVYESEDGTMTIEYRGQEMKWQEITASTQRQRAEAAVEPGAPGVERRRRGNAIPGVDHPWRRKAVTEKQRQEIRRWRDGSLSAPPSSASP